MPLWVLAHAGAVREIKLLLRAGADASATSTVRMRCAPPLLSAEDAAAAAATAAVAAAAAVPKPRGSSFFSAKARLIENDPVGAELPELLSGVTALMGVVLGSARGVIAPALMVAGNDALESCRALLGAGCPLDARDGRGQTALFHAAATAQLDVAGLLLGGALRGWGSNGDGDGASAGGGKRGHECPAPDVRQARRGDGGRGKRRRSLWMPRSGRRRRRRLSPRM